MKFQNTNAVAELNFSVRGTAYKVAPDGEVDIDPAHVPFVISRGLQLAPVAFKPKSKVEAPKPAAPAAKPKTDPKAVAAALVAAVSKPIEPAKPTA